MSNTTRSRAQQSPFRADSGRVFVASFIVAVVLAACGGGETATTTITSPPASTTTAAATTTPSTTLPEIPVGRDGFEYRGGGPETEIVGPYLLAAAPDGTISIADPLRIEIRSFGPAGPATIALPPLDILNVTAMTASAEELIVVEVFFAPVRQRIHRFTRDGVLRDSVDLPPGARLEDGLSGVLVDDAGRAALLLEGGARLVLLDWDTGAFTPSESITLAGHVLTQAPPDFSIDGTAVPADLIGKFGGLRALGAADDGTVLLVREEVTSLSPVTVLATVEWYAADGAFLGSARVPLERQAISQTPGLVATTDGRALALLAESDAVRVVELERTPVRITTDSGGTG